jgi:class 3 adenylate cyclase
MVFLQHCKSAGRGGHVETSLGIIFADIAGSTRLYEMLGDSKAREAVGNGLAVLTRVTERVGGRVVKTIGDELMATFLSPDTTVAAAIAMQDAILDVAPIGGRRMAIRVGLHFGPVLSVDTDVFGDAVNVAARMASQAKPGEILTTGLTVALLEQRTRRDCRQIGWIEVKGKTDPVEIYEVLWRVEEATTMRAVTAPSAPPMRVPALRLVLSTAEGRSFEIGAELPTVTLGRGDDVSFTVPYARVSRQHARIELRNDRFRLTDQSANGTFMQFDDGPLRFVHRDSCDLASNGVLGLGEEPTVDSPARVRFEIVT